MLDTCYAVLESIVTVTVLLVVLMFRALVEFVSTLAWQEVHDSELYLVLQLPLTCFIARTHNYTHTYLATGPCFMLYNGMLRGFGNCGEVPASEDVEYGSEEFWKLLGAKTVADRMKKAGHKFSSTMHALASAIKKIQGIAEDGQGTRLYRGLGKLLTQLFAQFLLIFDNPIIVTGKCF